MIRLLAILMLLATSPLAAQIMPQPDPANPRLQSVQALPGREIMLAALPETDLTLLFPPYESIRSVDADQSLVGYSVSPELNALVLAPLAQGSLGRVRVVTDRAIYQFSLRTGDDLMAAYVVRIADEREQLAQRPSVDRAEAVAQRWWSYRIKGKDAVKPVGIRDDGEKTYILFSPDQLLPAIFAISPTGDETLTNGYMRGAQFVLDRVWQELVFRIDGKKATARRNERPDG